MATITATTSTQVLTGTSSNDTFIIKSIYNKIVESTGSFGGIDTLKTGVLNALGIYGIEAWTGIENLTYTGTLAATLKGNDLNNVIMANASASTADTLYGGKGHDALYGYGGADNLQGGDGNDILYAGVDTAADVLIGGTGSDMYYDVTSADIVIETARGGYDTVVTGEQKGRYLDLRNFANLEGVVYTGKLTATLYGNSAANSLNAIGSTGAITLYGYGGNDTLTGGSVADKLDGGDGDDILNGNGGADTMTGGNGNDIYQADVSTDVITEAVDAGIDTIIGAKASIALSAYATTIENLVYTGTADLAVTGNAMDNLVVGGSGKNTVTGGNGNDIVIGGRGIDTVQGNAGNDILYGGEATDIAYSTYLLQNHAIGGLSSSADGVADTLVGGAGSDVYLIDELGDKITELSTDTGVDIVLSRVDFSLKSAANVEALVLDEIYNAYSAATTWSATGSDKGDVIIGNSGENYLQGGLGDDILAGDLGGTYSSWTTGPGTVTDVVDGGAGNDILLAMGHLNTTTTGYWDPVQQKYVTVTSGTLDSNIDSVLLGGAGDDFYIDMNGAAEIHDTAGTADVLYLMTSNVSGGKEGIEQIVLAGGLASYDTKALDALNKVNSVADLALGSRYQPWNGSHAALTEVPTSAALNAAGNGLANIIYGNSLSNELWGGAGDDKLYGGAGNDVLHGDAGKDTLVGGLGDDVYEIDTGDIVQEKAGEGLDIVRSATATSYTSYANIEGLEYTGTAGATLQNGTSNTTNDLFYGGSGNDTMNGWDGNDTLYGGKGADVINGGNGNDTLYGSSFATGTGQLLADAGNTIRGGAGDDKIIGGSGADKLYGDAGNEDIVGGEGDDTIDGGTGNDAIQGEEGNDTILADNGNDLIYGGVGSDVIYAGAIVVEGGIFTGQDRMYGGDDWLGDPVADKDLFRFGASSMAQFNSASQTFGSSHQILGFNSKDQVQVARALVGDGDTTIEGGVVKGAGGTFSSAAELVIVTDNIGFGSFQWGSINAYDVVNNIGQASTAFKVGDQRLFVVDDGTMSAVFKFTSKDASATVTADELQLVTLVTGQDLALTSFGLY